MLASEVTTATGTTTNEDLVRRYQEDGDPAALAKLVKQNRGLVGSIIREIVAKRLLGDRWADLLQEGMIALIDAAKKFDPARGFKFSTYATLPIRWRVMQANQRLIRHADREYSLTDLADLDGFQTSQWERGNNPIDGLTSREADPADIAAQREIGTILLGSIADLPPRYAEVITECDMNSRTREELAERFAVSKQRISQIRDKAILRLRRALAPVMGKDAKDSLN